MSIATIILAAGKGTRMNSDLAKVLHPIANVPMLHHAMATAATLEPTLDIVVTGHQAEAVAAAARDFDADVQIANQEEQLGTGHAVQMAAPLLDGFEGRVVILFGDTPFIQPETMQNLMAATSDITILAFDAADPGRYGRVVSDGDTLERIVEWKDASPEERDITLCNSGVMCISSTLLNDLIFELSDTNDASEFYLTELPALARKNGHSASVVLCDEAETLGVNTLAELSDAEQIWQNSRRRSLMEDGVYMQAPDTVQLAFDTEIGRGASVEPNVVFGLGVTVESDARIRAFSHLEGAHVSRGATVGPYARLRPGAELSEHVHVGNFVEIKNAVVAEGAKINHLSYVGDARIGARTNIGAGTITCNYDGVMKHKTEIGADAFIGSNTMLVAPVTLGSGSMTGSGSVITSDVEPDALAISRAPQVEKPGMARKLLEMLRARKAQKDRSN
ncbi:MAG: bifunctional UDP-N-acetylglucosamine diphosphorylase/glucosamine-1-phosphate N-acetyltransferase GlmU [Paracoccaceae bacterium]